MPDTRRQAIRDHLDAIELDEFEKTGSVREAAAQHFQDLLVRYLNFEIPPTPAGGSRFQIDVDEWRKSARANAAYEIASSRTFRTFYVEVESLTKTAERNAIASLVRSDRTSGYAVSGEFLVVFHAPGERVWHLVTPYEEDQTDITEGRPVLRRFTLGEGEQHRTVADNLNELDASKGQLSNQVENAFNEVPVTKRFYGEYKSTYDTLSDELKDGGMAVDDAERYAHLVLNRLMFTAFLQKKGWIGESLDIEDRKNFTEWYYEAYAAHGGGGEFHRDWLSSLFVDAMNTESWEDDDGQFPPEVRTVLESLPYMNGNLFQRTDVDELDVYLSDEALENAITSVIGDYNFTVTEQTAYDIDIDVDPTMLGKIYESLIARENRGESGIFYTGRQEVDLICRKAVLEQLRRRADGTDLGDDELIAFVFSDPESGVSEGLKETVEPWLDELSIVDPACGSGAFLTGLFQVLTELYEKLGVQLSYESRLQIVNNSIYGVDIKDWAVRVAEFRLWLGLIEPETEVPSQTPVLPNFSFNVQSGDSLIQQVGDQRLSVQALGRSPSDDVQRKLHEVEDLKRRYFDGEFELESEIERRQTELLREHISELIDRLNSGEQQTLRGGVTRSSEDQRQKLAIERLESVRDNLDASGSERSFTWELNFSEVMLNGGFDAVIGNPPYVSTEFITDPWYSQDQLDEMSPARVSEIQDQYKSQLSEYVQEFHGFDPDGQSDYYAFFFYKGMELLKEGGTLSYITSDKWLDRDYGTDLQRHFLKETRLESVIANRNKRSFEQADITTAITTLTRDSSGREGTAPRFVSCHKPYESIYTPETVSELFYDGSFDSAAYKSEEISVLDSPVAKVVRVAAPALWRLGGGSTSDHGSGGRPRLDGTYSGAVWGSVFLRTPTPVFEILDRTNEDDVRRLREFDVQSYLNARGAKGFFVVEEVARLGGDSVRIENTDHGEQFEVEDQFLKPFVGSPSNVESIRIDEDDTNGERIVVVPEDTDIDSYDVGDYIEFGESAGYDTASGNRNKDTWYQPPTRAKEAAPVALPRTHNTNHRAFYNPDEVVTGRFYRARFEGASPEEVEFASLVLNSTLGSLFMEIYGDTRGQGALDLYTDDYKRLPVILPSDVDTTELEDRAYKLLDRNPGTAFEELGVERPDESDSENTNSEGIDSDDIDFGDIEPDRRALDQFVMGTVFEVTKEKQREVYAGLLQLVDERLKKANSV